MRTGSPGLRWNRRLVLRRRLVVGALAVAALGAVVLLTGGSSARNTGPGSRPATQRHSPSPPERPADVSLLLTGAQLGRMEPCGCTQPQQGGLRRLAALAERLSAASPPPVPVQLGSPLPVAVGDQEVLKAERFARTFAAIGFRCLHLGAQDVPLRAHFDVGLPRVVARPPLNVRLGPASGFPGPIGRVPAGAGQEVRTVLVAAPECVERLRGSGQAVDGMEPLRALSHLSPDPSRPLLIATEGCDLMQAEFVAEARRLSPSVLISLGVPSIGTHASGLADLAAGPAVLGLADRGREALLLSLWHTPDGWIARYRYRSLGPELEPAEAGAVPAGRDPVAAIEAVDAARARYLAQIRDADLLAGIPSRPGGPAEPRYAGSAACAPCHGASHAEWASSRHASALSSLAHVGQEWNPECVVCHTLGFERLQSGPWLRGPGAFATPGETPELGSVGCESCHGPLARHVETPLDTAVWGRAAGGVARPDVDRCRRCHDAENSPGFEARLLTGGGGRVARVLAHRTSRVAQGGRESGKGGESTGR